MSTSTFVQAVIDGLKEKGYSAHVDALTPETETLVVLVDEYTMMVNDWSDERSDWVSGVSSAGMYFIGWADPDDGDAVGTCTIIGSREMTDPDTLVGFLHEAASVGPEVRV